MSRRLPALLLLVLVGCRPAAAVTVAGSTSVLPFVELLAQEYMMGHPGRRVNVQPGGSTAGVQAVLSGAADLAMVSRPLTATEAELLLAVPVARDAIAVVVHRNNPVPDLSLEQVRAIFTGLAGDWSMVGGEPAPITIVSREEGSGTRAAFDQLVLGRDRTAAAALVQDSNGAVREIIAADPRAIGYLSLGLVDDRLRALAIDGQVPTVASVKAGQYPLVRDFFLVHRRQPLAEPVADLLTFVLSPAAQTILAREGLIPVATEP